MFYTNLNWATLIEYNFKISFFPQVYATQELKLQPFAWGLEDWFRNGRSHIHSDLKLLLFWSILTNINLLENRTFVVNRPKSWVKMLLLSKFVKSLRTAFGVAKIALKSTQISEVLKKTCSKSLKIAKKYHSNVLIAMFKNRFQTRIFQGSWSM